MIISMWLLKFTIVNFNVRLVVGKPLWTHLCQKCLPPLYPSFQSHALLNVVLNSFHFNRVFFRTNFSKTAVPIFVKSTYNITKYITFCKIFVLRSVSTVSVYYRQLNIDFHSFFSSFQLNLGSFLDKFYSSLK